MHKVFITIQTLQSQVQVERNEKGFINTPRMSPSATPDVSPIPSGHDTSTCATSNVDSTSIA